MGGVEPGWLKTAEAIGRTGQGRSYGRDGNMRKGQDRTGGVGTEWDQVEAAACALLRCACFEFVLRLIVKLCLDFALTPVTGVAAIQCYGFERGYVGGKGSNEVPYGVWKQWKSSKPILGGAKKGRKMPEMERRAKPKD